MAFTPLRAKPEKVATPETKVPEVPPAAMEKVRALVRNEPSADDSLAADEATARENHIDRTPTLVCNREVIAGSLSLGEIQARLDRLLAQ